MEIAFIISIFLMVGFVTLAMFDGMYLHLIRYKLYAHAESKGEHLSHTIRAVLFPLIVWFLYLSTTDFAFYIGLAVVIIDLLVLGADAYLEKDSRSFMGGLPRWEYILHLAVNGFHFAAIAVLLVIKVRLQPQGLTIIHDFDALPQYSIFRTIAIQLIPGGILMALVHFALIFPTPANLCDRICGRFKCC